MSRPAVRLAIVPVVLVAFGLRVLHLGDQSLWYDEIWAVYTAGLGPLAVLKQPVPDQLPLHYLLLWLWTHFGGSSEYSARLLSVVVGTASVPLLYKLLRLFDLESLAVAGGAILAVSAFHVNYAQEARMHELACFLVLGAAYALIRGLQQRRGAMWWAYGITTAACLYTFYYTALPLLALNLAALVWARKPPSGWWKANALALLAWAPWLAITYGRVASYVSERVTLTTPVTVGRILFQDGVELQFGNGASAFPAALLGVPAILLALLCAGVILAKGRATGALLPLAWAVVPMAAINVLSFRLPVFSTRYLLTTLPAWIAVAMIGLAWGRTGGVSRWLRPVAALAGVTFLAGTGLALANGYANPNLAKDNYREALRLVSQEATQDEALIYDLPLLYVAVDYYAPHLAVPAFGLPVSRPRNMIPEFELAPASEDRPATEQQLAELAGQYSGFWLLLSGDVENWTEQWLDSHSVPISNQWYGQGMRLKHYRPGPSSPVRSLPGASPADASFGGLHLRQVRSTIITPGQPLLVDLLWEVVARPSDNFTVSAQLFDSRGQKLAQADGPPLAGIVPTSSWQPGYGYPDRLRIPVPSFLESGVFTLKISVYDDAGDLLGQQASAARLVLDPDKRTSQVDAVSNAGWSIERVDSGTDAQGNLIVSLAGRVDSSVSQDLTWFGHLLDARGGLITQDDHPPLARSTSWQAGDTLFEVFQLPAKPSPGDSVEVGAYDPAGRRVLFGVADHLEVPLGSPS